MNIDLVDLLSGFMKMSQAKLKSRDLNDFKKWKQCVALTKLGWTGTCDKEDNSEDIVVTWKKEGKPNIQIRLSLIEQRLWLEYLEKKEK